MEVAVILLNTLRPRQNGRHFADEIFKCIFLNEDLWISIKISLKFVPRCPINNIPALVEIMAWCRPGDKPLYEPMMVSLPTHICATRPQWVYLVFWIHYIPVRNKSFHTIHIYITDETGACIPFHSGRSMVTLHFRQKLELLLTTNLENLPVYSGLGFQRGAGIANILGGLWLAVVPILKRGTKAAGKRAIKAEIKVASDVIMGCNVKTSVKRRGAEALKAFLGDVNKMSKTQTRARGQTRGRGRGCGCGQGA